MTVQERYELSCYEEVTRLQNGKDIWLVHNSGDETFYVKKRIELYNKAVYMRLMQEKFVNIPGIVLCVEDEGKLIVIEEYVHGSSLKKLLEKEGAFSEQKVRQIVISLCDILEQLHNCQPPIIHRDIKPSNIMISNDGVIKLIDFNAAKEYSADRREDTRLMGTKKFAAPEQYGFGQSDPRTDIYAIGVTMECLLTEEKSGEDKISEELQNIIKICTELDKERRFQNVGALRNALKNEESELAEVNTPQDVSQKKNIFTKSLYSKKPMLPVGFRSGVLWKMIVAVYGYAVILWMSFTMDFEDKNGAVMKGYPLWANRIAIFVVLLGSVFFIGNYGNIRYQLPLMKKNKVIHWILASVYLFVFFFLVITILVMAGG